MAGDRDTQRCVDAYRLTQANLTKIKGHNTMNTYVGMWQALKVEVSANSAYEAQTKAHALLQKMSGKRIKPYAVTVMVLTVNGAVVTHKTSDL